MSDYLDELHDSLDGRLGPEDVLRIIVAGNPGALEDRFARLARPALKWPSWSSMSTDFARPVDGGRVLASVGRAFQVDVSASVDDADSLRGAACVMGAALGWSPEAEAESAGTTHLTREQRAAQGIGLSRRQYNRQWRALRRLNAKADALASETRKRDLILIGRSGFTGLITRDRFRADPLAAHFTAYWAARKNQRRQFSLAGKSNPMDEVALSMLARCEQAPDTDWEMIAYARPAPDVLGRLTDHQRGDLLGRWTRVMRDASALLAEVWDPQCDRASMVVRRGQDSSTWNTIAQAYNAARASWLACLSSLGMEAALDAACPGKVMRLMAGDLAYWHQSSGGDVDPNTAVWAALPLPWQVLNGDVTCTRADVERACRMKELDPQATGWTAPRAQGDVAAFAFTPELVHGVTIADPIWAGLLRRAGVFSGKHVTADRELASHAATGLASGVVVSDLPERIVGDW